MLIALDRNYYCTYNKSNGNHFDPAKNDRNIHERGLSFEWVRKVDFNAALLRLDTRKEYGEARYIALCCLDSRLHVLCLTEREAGIRFISLRKANDRDAQKHSKLQTLD